MLTLDDRENLIILSYLHISKIVCSLLSKYAYFLINLRISWTFRLGFCQLWTLELLKKWRNEGHRVNFLRAEFRPVSSLLVCLPWPLPPHFLSLSFSLTFVLSYALLERRRHCTRSFTSSTARVFSNSFLRYSASFSAASTVKNLSRIAASLYILCRYTASISSNYPVQILPGMAQINDETRGEIGHNQVPIIVWSDID